MKKITGLMGLLAVVYIIAMTKMYLTQRDYLYFPLKTSQGPADVGLSGVETVTFSTADGEKIRAWYVPARAGNPVILFFHGNAGFVGRHAGRLSFFQKNGVGALFVSYRGYGASTGSPSGEGLVNDALSAYDWLVENGIGAGRIAVIGESLGSAVAVQLAARRPVMAVVLEAPFTSIADMAKVIYWWLPVDLLLKDRFDSIGLIKRINAPLLISHGDQDEVVGVSHGRRLFDAASQPKQLNIIKGGKHGSFSTEDVWAGELAFILGHAGPR